MCLTPPSLNTIVQAAKLRLLSTLAPPFLLSAKVGSHNTTANALEELQAKFDELEAAGVFTKPEQVNVHVDYPNTSFLVKKPNGGSRLVTSFGEVSQYNKLQPSLMPNVDIVLREIGKWKFMVITDLL